MLAPIAGVLVALFALERALRPGGALPAGGAAAGMTTISWCLTAGFAGLVVLGFPFAIAIALAITAALLLADIEPAFLAQAADQRQPAIQPARRSRCSCWRAS